MQEDLRLRRSYWRIDKSDILESDFGVYFDVSF